MASAASDTSTKTKSHKHRRELSSLTSSDLRGKYVFVRVDFNVPLDKKNPSVITDDTRIRESLPSLRYLSQQGARVVLASHLGRPKGKDLKLSLKPVALRLKALLGLDVLQADDCIGEGVRASAAKLKDGDILLLENVRFYKEEEANDPKFAQALAASSLAQVYVNDAFGTAHRAHASTAGVKAYIKGPAVAGFLMAKELKYLYTIVDNPPRPFAAIIGGAKVASKIGVIESLLQKCDKLVLGGGMVYPFLKARGLSIGSNKVEDDKVVDIARDIEASAKRRGVELVLPVDLRATTTFANDPSAKIFPVDALPEGYLGLDIGPQSERLFQEKLMPCRAVFWNGPMGVFEFPAFAAGTNAIALTLAQLTAKGAITVVGGGDSVAAVNQLGVANRISHISTGGGASLELIEGATLPGVEVLDPI
jgi:phosphoglycerate kinase